MLSVLVVLVSAGLKILVPEVRRRCWEGRLNKGNSQALITSQIMSAVDHFKLLESVVQKAKLKRYYAGESN